MGSPLTSIIIRCYNESDYIGRLLHGITQQSLDDYEIILVDSGSTDGTLEIACQYDIDEIIYIDPEKFSFGRSLNQGCAAASGEFCVFASAHVYPKRDDWLERLLEKFDDEGEVALVYGKQRGNEVTPFSENQIFKQWYPEEDIDFQDHPFCNNANAAVRREVWKEFPYDEQLTGLEDLDWAKRVKKAGYAVTYAATAEVVHVHDESPREIFNRHRREAYAYKQIMPDRSFSWRDFIRLSIYHVLSDYRRAIYDGALLENLIEIPKFRLLQFWGTYRGFSREAPISRELWQHFFYPDRNSFPDGNRQPDSIESKDAVPASEIDYPDTEEYSGTLEGKQ